jgi:hypothetical protein
VFGDWLLRVRGDTDVERAAAVRQDGSENRWLCRGGNPSVVSQKFLPEIRGTKADSSLTTPELKNVRGPVHSE